MHSLRCLVHCTTVTLHPVSSLNAISRPSGTFCRLPARAHDGCKLGMHNSHQAMRLSRLSLISDIST